MQFYLNGRKLVGGNSFEVLGESMKLTILLLSAVLLLIVGCASGELAQNLEEGMSKEQVIAIMGKPDGFQRSGEYEALKYTNRVISGWDVRGKADYAMILKNGRLVEWGAGQVRQSDSALRTLVLVPLQ
ncbi:MAG: outer membrane protein assembly factor BamE [Pseudomonadota bacterium]|nr:hypothetical protein [Burkholderiales bacterium]MDQ3197261.1 outer membrane protein assembly factor BamE [Pseudomonadota bacterium]